MILIQRNHFCGTKFHPLQSVVDRRISKLFSLLYSDRKKNLLIKFSPLREIHLQFRTLSSLCFLERQNEARFGSPVCFLWSTTTKKGFSSRSVRKCVLILGASNWLGNAKEQMSHKKRKTEGVLRLCKICTFAVVEYAPHTASILIDKKKMKNKRRISFLFSENVGRDQ